MFSTRTHLLVAASMMTVAGAALGQPQLVGTGMFNSDLTADGNTTVGTIFVPDLELTEAGSQSTAYRFTRGIGSIPLGTRRIANGTPVVSSDGQTVSCQIYNNPENWANLETLVPYGPLPTIKGHTLTGRWTAGTNWVNLGSFPNVGGLGAAHCDAGVNTPYDISGDGRFIVGWAHYGTFLSTNCVFQPSVYDATSGTWSLLPFRNSGISPGSLALSVSSNGAVVEGYDNGAPPDPIPGVSPFIPNPRALVVWERTNLNQPFPANSETILDYFGSGDKGVVNSPGTVIAAALSSNSAQYVECDLARFGDLVKYVKTAPSGACCLSAASCVLTDPQACELQGGWYAGAGVTCAAAACSSVQYGACCTSLRGCNITSSARCTCFGGTFTAGGICAPSPCPGTPILAACCAGSACQVVDETFCRAIGGRPASGTTTCSPTPCPATNWYRVHIGRVPGTGGNMTPTNISDDGNTIVGAIDGSSFIWRPTLNGGVPMRLSTYLTSLNGGNPFPGGGISIGGVDKLSADGNAMTVTLADNRDTCPGTPTSHFTGGAAILYLDGSAIPCEAPRIVLPPQNLVVHNVYDTLGTALNVIASGSWPLNFEWQVAPTSSGPWTTPTESCSNFVPPFDFEGVYKPQIRIGGTTHDGYYRCVVSNACGSIASEAAQVRFAVGACCYLSGGFLTCSIQAQNVCIGSPTVGWLGGAYAGDFTTCTPTPEDPCANSTGSPVTGACCIGFGGPDAQCLIDTQANCARSIAEGGNGGSFAGIATVCGPAACGAVSGACCYAPSVTQDVVCTVELQAYCTSIPAAGGLAGTFRGTGTTCSPTACNTVAGACCYSPDAASDLICRVQTRTRCESPLAIPSAPYPGLAGIFVGEGTACAPIAEQCGFVAGACCYSLDDTSSVICTLQLDVRCTRSRTNSGLGGTFRGSGTTCTPTSCTNVTGACCYSTSANPSTLLCTIQPQTRCTSRFNIGGLFGNYRGPGTTCTPTACDAVVGACCHVTPATSNCTVCSLQPKDASGNGSLRCTDPNNGGLGGAYSGPATTCASPSCNLGLGACCVFQMACFTTCDADCTGSFGGTFHLGSTCTPDPCAPPTGACCCGASCSVTTAALCTGTTSTFSGMGTACTPFSLTSPCCRGNFNKSVPGPGAPGGVSVQDIFDFLIGYFSNDPCANTNDSAPGAGAPNGISVQDIFDFLSAYFGGC